MFIVDQAYTLEEVSVLAAHAEQIDPYVRNLLEEHWTGEQSIEFLRGLLTGYANSHALHQVPELAQREDGRPVSTLAAFVAVKLLKKFE